MNGYRMESGTLGSRRLAAGIYPDGKLWRWRAYARDPDSLQVVAEQSGAEETEEAARVAAQAWWKQHERE